jgi:hypothetical protein
LFEILEISLGNLSRLYGYIQKDLFSAKYGLKGFDNPWILESHAWKAGEKVLDIGAAYSKFPSYLYQTFNCEMWAVDDFGMTVDDPFWTRGNSPQEFISSHPEVKYLMERLGDPEKSSLPRGYFDVVYSISVLEHIPQSITPAVWRHMDTLLKPGGEMLHAVDIFFPSNGGLKKVLGGWVYDTLYGLVPQRLRVRYCFATPQAYVRLALASLGVPYRPKKELNIWNTVLNPEIVTEDPNHGLNRILKDHLKNYRYQRAGTLLIRLRKTA